MTVERIGNTSDRQDFQLQPGHALKDKGGTTQWYRLDQEEVSFTDTEYRFGATFSSSGVRFFSAKRCTDDSFVDELAEEWTAWADQIRFDASR